MLYKKNDNIKKQGKYIENAIFSGFIQKNFNISYFFLKKTLQIKIFML